MSSELLLALCDASIPVARFLDQMKTVVNMRALEKKLRAKWLP